MKFIVTVIGNICRLLFKERLPILVCNMLFNTMKSENFVFEMLCFNTSMASLMHCIHLAIIYL